jgi:thioesterase domain-containing protein
VIVAREDTPGDKRLVAYLVAKAGVAPAVADLRNYLRQDLPECMMPSALVRLERMPLTPSGKVDRRALPPPDQDSRDLGAGYVAPRTALEAQLAAIWTEVLGLKQVGLHDNFFFDLGGHSLLAARLISKIHQITGKSVPLAIVFRDPTVAGMSHYLQRPPVPVFDLVEPLRISGSRAPILWFGNGRPLACFVARLPSEHPLYWCKPEYLDGRKLHHASIEDLAGQYCHQLHQLDIKGPVVLCGYSFGGLLAYATARRLQELGQEAILLFLLEPTPPRSMAGRGSSLHETLGQRVAREVCELRSARAGEKLPCINRKAKALFRFVTWPFVLAYCESLLAFRRPLPVCMRWNYALSIYRRTIRDYTPQPVRAKLVLVHEENYMEGRSGLWAGLAAGKFCRHVLPSAGHLDFLTMPYVERWMNLLLTYLYPSSG